MGDYDNNRIYPLHLGTLLKPLPDGDYAKTPVIAYLVSNNERFIMVDTGASGAEHSEKYHYKMIQPEEMTLKYNLERLGLTFESIDTVVCTHLHWDHIFNIGLFPRAKVYVQRAELICAINPIPSQYIYYEALQMGMTPSWINQARRFELIEGDFSLAPGIDMILLPGHTSGFMGVLARASNGRYLIASDCVANMSDWETRCYGYPTPSAIHMDLEVYYMTLKKMTEICDHILPGHDFRAFEKAVYP